MMMLIYNFVSGNKLPRSGGKDSIKVWIGSRPLVAYIDKQVLNKYTLLNVFDYCLSPKKLNIETCLFGKQKLIEQEVWIDKPAVLIPEFEITRFY